MAKPNKRRKLVIFSIIGVMLVALTLVAVFKKRDPAITVQTEKVSRHSLTNLVVANGQIQPVVQVTISPEVSGEIIELPVKEGQSVAKGDLLLKINPDVYIAGGQPGQGQLRILPGQPKPRRRPTWKRPRPITSAIGHCSTANCFRNRTSLDSKPRGTWPRRNSTATTIR